MLSEKFKNKSVSSGTMATEDLLDIFLNFLSSEGDVEDKAFANKTREELETITSESARQDVLDDVFDRMDEIAPTDYYFGSHPDDGANYGYFILPYLDAESFVDEEESDDPGV